MHCSEALMLNQLQQFSYLPSDLHCMGLTRICTPKPADPPSPLKTCSLNFTSLGSAMHKYQALLAFWKLPINSTRKLNYFIGRLHSLITLQCILQVLRLLSQHPIAFVAGRPTIIEQKSSTEFDDG